METYMRFCAWVCVRMEDPHLGNGRVATSQPTAQSIWEILRDYVNTQPDTPTIHKSVILRKLISLMPFTEVKGHILATSPELFRYE
jgi:hypothetical protein